MKKILTGLVLLFSTVTFAQTSEIKVWPTKIPGELKAISYQEKINKAKSYSKVTTPTLTVYPAPAGNNSGAGVIICPGGGYHHLAFDHEGIQVAQYFNTLGINAFILKYRLPHDSIMVDKSVGPLQDVQEAIRIIRRNAVQYGVNTSKVGVIGFSAGGHLASTAATHYNDKVYQVSDTVSARPDFAILVYPVISMEKFAHKGSRENLLGKNPTKEQDDRFSNELQVTEQTPPVFLVHASDDKTVPVQNSINFYLACIQNKVPVEMHIYEKGGHGFGLALQTPSTQSEWSVTLKSWLKMRKIIAE